MWQSIYQFIRYWVFRFETWFLVLSFTTILVGFFTSDWVFEHDTISAGIVGVVYATWFSFVNYRISKDNLFKELFTELNARYDKMNEDLNAIYKTGEPRIRKDGESPSKTSEEIIVDYLILCSEEFLWYKKGRIPYEVWKNWKVGICYFISSENFREIVQIERQQGGSYYGLFEELDKIDLKTESKLMKKILKNLVDWWLPILLLALMLLFWRQLFKKWPNELVGIYKETFQFSDHSRAQIKVLNDSAIANLDSTKFTPTETGQIGDTFGGTLGPIIALGAAYLTFIAFWVQFRSNRQQRKDIEVERFENRFYELLNLYKYNVEEMNIANKFQGRKCFVRMFYEFEFIYLSAFELAREHKETLQRIYTKPELCDIAYKIMYFGVGSVSDDAINRVVKAEYHGLLAIVRKKLKKIQVDWQKTKTDSNGGYLEISVSTEERKRVFEYEIFYYPFDGNSIRLGHYYRHLFQSVKYVVESETIKTRKDKYEYLRILRSLLSNHEQLLLYYNSLTTFGQEWITKGYFTDFRFIKNIPMEFATFGVKPRERLSSANGVKEDKFGVLRNRFDEILFEWEETIDGKN